MTSSDGVTIHVDDSGHGHPIILVGGSTYDAASLGGLVAQLTGRYRCLAIDRRGHGSSGDAERYSMDLEVQDVVSVAREVAESLTLFGHSYGALVALRAAGRADNVVSLILYEPPLPLDGPIAPEMLAALRADLDAGRPRDALLRFLREIVRVPRAEMALVEQLPDAWFESRAHSTVREAHAASALDVEELLPSPRDVPTLLLLGSESPESMHRSTERLERDLRRTQRVVLQGQAHNAILGAPDLVAKEIDRFLSST